MKKTIFAAIIAIAAIWMLGGCSSSTKPITPTTNLTDFGSYTTANEQPAFGDPNIASQTAEATPYNDPYATAQIEDSLDNLNPAAVYAVRVVWGNLEKDSGITAPTDWSGRITISPGALLVTHTIRFEPGQDSLIPYPTETFAVPNYVEWVSKTSVSYDGLMLRVYVPPLAKDSNETVTLTFATAPFSITFTQSQLENLDTLIVLGPGNAVSFQSTQWDKNLSLRGPLAGVWGRDENGKGIFYGAWMSVNGAVVGTVKGNWGTDTTGQNVFVGKYIDNNGKFQGLIRGSWWMRGQGNNPAGHFMGTIFAPTPGDSGTANISPVGALSGHFKMGYKRQTGYFAGRWCVGGGCITEDQPTE